MTIQNPADFPLEHQGPKVKREVIPFPDPMPSVQPGKDGYPDMIDSDYIPLPDFGYIKIDASRSTKDEDRNSAYQDNETAVTVDEKGRRIIRDARDLDKKGYFWISWVVSSPYGLAVLKTKKINIALDGGDTLSTEGFDNNSLTGFAALAPDAEKLDLKEYWEQDAYKVKTKLMIPRVMFHKLRISVEEIKKEEGEQAR